MLRGSVSIPTLIDVFANQGIVCGWINNPTVLITPDSESYMFNHGSSSLLVALCPDAISLFTNLATGYHAPYADERVTGLERV